ncbi:MAG TPA: prepilin-type N-terminal cleavage/methylation domain-containing protein [Gemmatimonadaceae bacterium]|nr:prepilin-type N-terminal cleavage/methylation domain-containing protein [Gemmatimonadaceae bacterium]
MRRARRGMTLLEVTVALVIAGTALVSGAAVLGFLADQSARPAALAVVSASAVRATLRDWASESRLATEGDAEFRGRPADVRIGAARRDATSDELTFVTSAPTEVSATGTIVRLHVARGADTTQRGLVAELTPWRRAGTPVTRVLAPDATGLRVRYLSSLFGQRSWLDGWVSTSVLPAAIEIRIAFDTTTTANTAAARALLAKPRLVPLGARQ